MKDTTRRTVLLAAGFTAAAPLGLLYSRLTLADEAARVDSNSAQGNPLSTYQWRKRPLIVFAPAPNDDKLRQLRSAIHERRCELVERDMIVIEALGEQGAGAEQSKGTETAAALRRRFDVGPDAFTVILVGKDGGEKLRSRDLPDLNDVFSLIDGMPMRQREMQEQDDTCRE